MFCLGGFCPGVFGKGGFCPGGFCPGVYVRGGFVRGVFVLEPTSPYETGLTYEFPLNGYITSYTPYDCIIKKTRKKIVNKDTVLLFNCDRWEVKFPFYVCNYYYCLTKISIRAKRSISRVFSLFIVPSPFFCTLPVQRPY